MALYTPLARLGTFLFPTQSRRVSAPAPASPHDGPKRRSAIAASDSPPRCRRRLSFADTDVVIEYAACATPPALLAAAKALPALPAPARPAAWAELAGLARAAPGIAGLEEPAVRGVFLAAFGASGAPPAPADELAAAVGALDAVLSHSASPLSARDEPLVEAILRVCETHVTSAALVEAVARLVIGDDWSRVFTPAMSRAAASLGSALVSAVANPNLEPRTWEALLQLLGVCAESFQRSRSMEGHDCHAGAAALQLSRAEAATVLASFERLADRDAGNTENALRAMMPVLAHKPVAAAFAVENASAVFSEVSSTFLRKLSIQHACIDLLVALSSPKIFYYAPDA